ncbi:hypothetical protein V8F06_006675 [Rhypophila decipiens]
MDANNSGNDRALIAQDTRALEQHLAKTERDIAEFTGILHQTTVENDKKIQMLEGKMANQGEQIAQAQNSAKHLVQKEADAIRANLNNQGKDLNEKLKTKASNIFVDRLKGKVDHLEAQLSSLSLGETSSPLLHQQEMMNLLREEMRAVLVQEMMPMLRREMTTFVEEEILPLVCQERKRADASTTERLDLHYHLITQIGKDLSQRMRIVEAKLNW